jgi:hypothetical protein
MVNTDIYKQAFDTMKGTGISSLGPSYAPTFTPNIVSNPWDVIDDVSQSYDVSFPTREMADRFDYGYGQMVGHMTNKDGSIDPWRYRDSWGEDFVNPNVFGSIYGGGPDGEHNRGARLVAEQFNNPSITENFDYVGPQQDLLKMIAWNNAMNAGEIDVDEMYMDEDPTYATMPPELYMTQEEQVANEPNAFINTLMEKYGRGNPFAQNLGGTYENYFGETFGMDEDQVGIRNIDQGYKLAYADSPLTSPKKQIYPDEQFLPSPYTPPIAPALPPGNIGFDRSPNPQALPPKHIGFDRAGPGSDMMDFVNYTQTWQTIAERLGIEAANEWLAKEQSTNKAHLGNYDLYHLMSNGYTLEEAQAELERQLG